jgi:hypothetical protein
MPKICMKKTTILQNHRTQKWLEADLPESLPDLNSLDYFGWEYTLAMLGYTNSKSNLIG